MRNEFNYHMACLIWETQEKEESKTYITGSRDIDVSQIGTGSRDGEGEVKRGMKKE